MQYTALDMEGYEQAYALWRETPGMRLSAADSPEAVAAYFARNPGQSFACWQGSRLVGTILCGNDGRRAVVYHLAVAQDCRGRGIGRKLVQTALAKQKQLGIARAVLFVLRDNETGLAFWRSVGFGASEEAETMFTDL